MWFGCFQETRIGRNLNSVLLVEMVRILAFAIVHRTHHLIVLASKWSRESMVAFRGSMQIFT